MKKTLKKITVSIAVCLMAMVSAEASEQYRSHFANLLDNFNPSADDAFEKLVGYDIAITRAAAADLLTQDEFNQLDLRVRNIYRSKRGSSLGSAGVYLYGNMPDDEAHWRRKKNAVILWESFDGPVDHTIVIEEGVTVVIVVSQEQSFKMKRTSSCCNMPMIQNLGTLIIKGNPATPLTIHGGSTVTGTYTNGGEVRSVTADGVSNAPLIELPTMTSNTSRFFISNVDIRNNLSRNNSGRGLVVSGNNHQTSALYNVKFIDIRCENNKSSSSTLGGGILLSGCNFGEITLVDGSKFRGVLMNHCTFRGCLTDGIKDFSCESRGNTYYHALSAGSALCVQGGELNVNLLNSTIESNYCSWHGGAIFWNLSKESCKLKLDGSTFKNNWGALGGAVYSEGNIDLNNVTFIGNKAFVPSEGSVDNLVYNAGHGYAGSGGAVYVRPSNAGGEAPTCVANISNSTFENNTAIYDGGGLVIYSDYNHNSGTTGNNVVVTLNVSNNTLFKSNTSGRVGGALAVMLSNDLEDGIRNGTHSFSSSMNLAGGVLQDNTVLGNATNNHSYRNHVGAGGAVYLEKSTTTISNNSKVINNTSFSNGGGIYIDGANATISTCELSGNTSNSEGGALCVSGGDVLITDGNIKKNIANGNGGAVAASGGNVTINGGTISDNKAKISGTKGGNGGAFYISSTDNSKKIMVNQGSISDNEAQKCGGAFCVTNGFVEITYGVINKNVALEDGGGLYASGGTVHFNKDGVHFGSIIGNTARNGGGLYLTNGALMRIQEALITENHAIGSQTINTAYHSDSSLSGNTIQGMGGGVYVANGVGSESSERTTLVFLKEDEVVCLGIYGNIADNGGDEIVADGNNTALYIPAVTDMQLSVFGGTSQGWFEDFIEDDSAYLDPSKTDVIRAAQGVPVRYREQIKSGKKTFAYSADLSTAETRYACLALGSALGNLTIKKTGLKAGESSIFSVSRSGYPDRSAILTGTGSGEVSTTLNNIDVGEWTVSETGWSWGYTPDQQTKEIIIYGGTKATPDKNIVTFSNTEKTENPKHAEAMKENVFSNEGAMSIKMGTETL